MTDNEALIAAIVGADCQTAEERRVRWREDTPRLAYADWCDENRKPQRAELIRLQIEVKLHENDREPPKIKLPVEPVRCKKCKQWYAGAGKCGCAYGDRRAAKHEELINNYNAWVAERKHRADREGELGRYCQDHRGQFYNLPEEVVVKGDWTWERGFCNKLRIKYDDWYEHGDLVLSRQPVEEVTVVLSDDQWDTYRRDYHNIYHATMYKWPGPFFHFQPQGNGTTLSLDEWLDIDDRVLRAARERLRRWAGAPLPLPVVHSGFSFDQRTIEMARLDMTTPMSMNGGLPFVRSDAV